MSGGSDVVGARVAVKINLQMRGLFPKACVSWVRRQGLDRGSGGSGGSVAQCITV
jgi:hypothetical protein